MAVMFFFDVGPHTFEVEAVADGLKLSIDEQEVVSVLVEEMGKSVAVVVEDNPSPDVDNLDVIAFLASEDIPTES
jgi:hypothetical protein